MLRQVAAALLAAVALIAMPAQAAPQKVRVALIASGESGFGYQVRTFAEGVERRLPGQFEFVVYPDAQLGKPDAIMNNIRLGALEMAVLSSTVIRLDKKFGIFDLPWLFASREHVKRAMMSPLGDEILAEVEEKGGLTALAIYETGFRQLMNSVRPVVEPEDLRGLKIRISGGKIRQQVFEAMGANPVPVVWNELYTAAQTGVVDGAEAAIFYLNDAKLHEMMPYLTFTNHVYSPAFLVASNAFFGSLTPEQQQAFREAALEVREGAYEFAAESDREIIDRMISETDLKTNEIDFPAFAEQVKPVYQEYIEEFGDDWLKQVEAARP